ncbi:MAG: DUF2911 domain-containing protein [Cyclobacteriaceae bacterium]
MKNQTILSVFVIVTLLACHSKKPAKNNQIKDSLAVTEPIEDQAAIIQEQSQPDSIKGSVQAEAVGKLDDTEIKISYYSPAVRGRIIWGGLVPFDKVWVTGAHSATSIEFNTELIVESKTIPAGKYAFFSIPSKKDWTLIINKNWRQHLTDRYDEKEDVLRIKITPETEEKMQERLRYVVEVDSEKEGEIVVYWEKLEISLPFKVK